MGLTFTSEMCADEKKRLNNEETSPQSFAVGGGFVDSHWQLLLLHLDPFGAILLLL